MPYVDGFRFNPLNQVYVFNLEKLIAEFEKEAESFNPLNQVYVFNFLESM